MSLLLKLADDRPARRGIRTRIELKLAQANARRVQAHYLALAGVERIKALIGQQELEPSTVVAACRFTRTAKEEELFKGLDNMGVTDGKSLMYSLRDELSYLNINNSDPASWENIRGLSRELRAGILDWIDQDEDTSPDGAESDFYKRLEPAYISKNADCSALKELLFLRTAGRHLYLGEDLNRNSLLDENERDGSANLPFDNGDSVLDLGLVDIFTVYGNGQMNINTVPKAILAALPGLDDEVANRILTHRAGPDGRLGTDDDNAITAVEDIVSIEGLTELQVELLGQYCCFESERFRIFSHARLDNGFDCCLMGTLSCVENQPRLLCLERLL
ncbi:MAG: type II secretion system minor pseudopilin [Planctomycetota bacterium]